MVEIIECREQITPAWLSDTLAAAGIKATVTDVEIEPIIAGYYGSSSRLTPRYGQDGDSLPRSLFLKMATEHESARERAAEYGMYRYEVGFYRDLADWVNIATPRCYAAEISNDNSAFVLLLEDAAPFVQVDQLQGLNLAQARLAMRELAGLHAPTWQGRGMESCHWAKFDEATANAFAQGMMQLKPAFVERFGAELSDENTEILDRLTLSAPDYWRYSLECKNQVAAHWDFRGDNMLFGQCNGELAMVTIDWTGLLSGGGRDLGHFLGTSLQSATRKAHELELLTHYHETLLAQGVTDFSLRECMDDYRINLLYPVYVVVSVTPSINVDARGQKLFMSMFNRACEAIKETDALELIESL
ncbi:MAG: DUF1679 domain-containing protein [Gammaproteobacteria bacterium]|nr:DUF1679 domain-containing protein [Gammaproteobacteria bacterium]